MGGCVPEVEGVCGGFEPADPEAEVLPYVLLVSALGDFEVVGVDAGGVDVAFFV